VPRVIPKYDLTGQTFGFFKVVRLRGSEGDTRGFLWECVCTKCGVCKHKTASQLRIYAHKQCGACRSKSNAEIAQAARVTHGKTRGGVEDATFMSWRGMHSRCSKVNNAQYAYYGGRGVRVCKRWASFEVFLKDMGPRPHGCTLDRINVNGDYTPKNCRWATRKEQSVNKRNTCNYTHNGRTLCLADWVRMFNTVSYSTARRRLRTGISLKVAFQKRPKKGTE
jgi:hypothetical protein